MMNDDIIITSWLQLHYHLPSLRDIKRAVEEREKKVERTTNLASK